VTPHPYAGRAAVLATKHGKQAAIAPVFRELLSMEIVTADVDTDAFGTFAGEIPRLDTPLKTAIAKARAGIEESGVPLGLASEGTIGPDPLVPFVSTDFEIIAFIDTERDIVISEWVRATNVVAFRTEMHPNDDPGALLKRADFPNHGLMVRSTDGPNELIIKGLTNESALAQALEHCWNLTGTAIVKSDFRAHHSPSRMAAIAECATLLAQRIAALCPDCASPGWGRIEPARGLPCSVCGTLVESAVRADRFGCPACPAERETPRTHQHVEPQWCLLCNP